MNLLTMMFLFGNLPKNLLFIFIYSTTLGEDGVDSFRTLVKITRFVDLLIRFVQCLLFVSQFRN